VRNECQRARPRRTADADCRRFDKTRQARLAWSRDGAGACDHTAGTRENVKMQMPGSLSQQPISPAGQTPSISLLRAQLPPAIHAAIGHARRQNRDADGWLAWPRSRPGPRPLGWPTTRRLSLQRLSLFLIRRGIVPLPVYRCLCLCAPLHLSIWSSQLAPNATCTLSLHCSADKMYHATRGLCSSLDLGCDDDAWMESRGVLMECCCAAALSMHPGHHPMAGLAACWRPVGERQPIRDLSVPVCPSLSQSGASPNPCRPASTGTSPQQPPTRPPRSGLAFACTRRVRLGSRFDGCRFNFTQNGCQRLPLLLVWWCAGGRPLCMLVCLRLSVCPSHGPFQAPGTCPGRDLRALSLSGLPPAPSLGRVSSSDRLPRSALHHLTTQLDTPS
jgi:hypothetical protein